MSSPSRSSGLHTTSYGETGARIVFCHGLFGQGKNWTRIAKELAASHRVTLVDMPDHGRSAWSERFDYLDAADRVAGLLAADDPVALVGHSMGGKIAMLLALRHPELVARLAVVDVSPVRLPARGGVRPLHRGDAGDRPRDARAPRRRRRSARRRRAQPGGAQLPAAEPAPPRRRLAVAAQPRAPRPRPRRDHGLARRPARRRHAVRRAGAVGGGRGLAVRPRGVRNPPWSGGSPGCAG